jgi:hypothetical protein
MDRRSTAGGSLRLLEILEAHPAEFAYDFRSRFHLSTDAIGYEVSFLEAIYLTSILLRDTSSWLQAAVGGWDYPVTREWIAITHTYDLLALVNSDKKKPKPKPYPTPYPNGDKNKIGSSKAKQSNSSVLEKLNQMNPKE